jgi:hypothetical protein
MPVRLASHRLPFSLSVGAAAPPVPPAPVPHHSGGGARVWSERPPQTARVYGRLRLDLGATGAVRSEQTAIGRVALQLGTAGRVQMAYTVAGRIDVAIGARGAARFVPGDSADELWLLGLDG